MILARAKFLFLSILTLFFSGKKNNDEIPAYETYVNQLINSFAKEIKKEFGLICIGDGGQMPYDVEAVSIKFAAYCYPSIEKARELEVKITERFINAINSNEKIRPYLREYPFKADRAEVAISFYTKDNSRYTDGSVSYVFQVKNKIYYCSKNPHTKNLDDLYEEPYEEALKIVQSSQKSTKTNL